MVGDTVRLTNIAGRQTAMDIGEVERVEHGELRAGRSGLLFVGVILAFLVGLISTADMSLN